MKGDFVIIREFGGNALVRRVWADSADVVQISAEEEFAKLVRGEEAIQPIGFPREDVFCYEPELEEAIRKNAIKWEELRGYK